MEGELISALEEIDRLRIKNRKKRQLLIQFEKDSKEPDQDLVLLKVELEEAKKIEEILKQQLLEKKARCESLEQEVVKTRKENREECHLRKHDESWLWHRRLGHLNFDHLIKLKNLEAVKDLPRISKP
jgi:hypothetical protein